ncbi:MAG: hypothetical protein ABIM88_01875 [candidate division WOR-3 bacterium]
MNREELISRLSHLPESRKRVFTDEELDVIARLMSACAETGQPQIDIRKTADGERHSYHFLIVAPDWAGMLDAVSGIIHAAGHNISYLTAMVDSSGKLAVIMMLLSLAAEEAKRFENQKAEFISLLKMAAQGGLSVRRMVTIGATKIRVFSAVLRELKHLAPPDEFAEIIAPGGELEQFITTRSESYLTERLPGDIALIILTQRRFQKKVKEGAGVQVKVSNIKTTKEHLTGVTVAGLDKFLSLDAVLDAIREFLPDYKRRYDKEFVTEDGVSVVRVEITDADYNPLSASDCLSLENFLRTRLEESRVQRRDLRLKSGAELIGRILVPRLIEETDLTERPQLLILPEGMEEGVVQFRLILVNRGEDLSDGIRRRLDEVKGIVVSSLKVSPARDKNICLFSLYVDSSYFGSEEEIYAAIKRAVQEYFPDVRDFDEGMRRMGVERLRRITEIVVERGISPRFAKRVFYAMDDAYRVTTPPEEIAEEIVFVQDILSRFLSKGEVVADYIAQSDSYFFGVAGPRGLLSLEPFVELLRPYDPIFTGLEMMGVNIYLFKLKKTKALKPKLLLKEMRQKEIAR